LVNATTLISGSRDATVRVWDLPTGHCTKILEGHTQTIRDIAVHDDFIVSGGYDKDARVWNWKTRECLKVLQHDSKIYAVELNGKTIATGGTDNDVRIWDPVSGYVSNIYSQAKKTTDFPVNAKQHFKATPH
jgi:F-box and WD-40 domain protein CDC4